MFNKLDLQYHLAHGLCSLNTLGDKNEGTVYFQDTNSMLVLFVNPEHFNK